MLRRVSPPIPLRTPLPATSLRNLSVTGRSGIRHRLNEALAQRGGHIGYGVRYGEWNRGYGTKMLALALEKAKELRISPVLITCNDDNLASARVMEKNGFVLGDTILVSGEGEELLTRRYWKTIL